MEKLNQVLEQMASDQAEVEASFDAVSALVRGVDEDVEKLFDELKKDDITDAQKALLDNRQSEFKNSLVSRLQTLTDSVKKVSTDDEPETSQPETES